MSTTSTIRQSDTRTPAQIAGDDAAARNDWEGFETEELLTMEGARKLLEHARSLRDSLVRNPGSASAALRAQPFRWQEKVFQLLRCDFVNGQADVQSSPNDPEFLAEVKRRIESNRDHHLDYCQAFGFACFPEDYQRYKG